MSKTKDVEWNDTHELVGKSVYTNRLPGKIVSVDEENGKYKVEQTDGKVRILSEGSFSFTARVLDYRYEKIDGKMIRDGRPSRGVNDAIGRALDGDEIALEQVCDENGIDFGKYSHLNPGMKRMAVGNILRARIKRGERVTVFEEEITDD